jgi:uroporphyrinogen-III decarboxylase
VAHLLPEPDASPADPYRNLQTVLGEDGIVRCCVYGPIDHQAGELMPPEDMMVNWLTDRPFVERLVGMFWRQVMAQTRLLLEAGVRVFFTPWYWHSLSVGWGPNIFREWFLPMIAEQVALVHAYEGLVFYYDDGRMMGIVPMLVEAGVDVVETCTPPPVGDFDLEEAVRSWGPRITFLGNTDLIYVLQRGTVEDVRRSVQRSCEAGRRGRFILGTTDGIREGTPVANLDAFFRYGREYGRTS